MYNVSNQIEFKTSIIRSNLYDYSDAYTHIKWTITVPNTGTATNPDNNKNVIFRKCTPFANCVSEINNAQLDPAHDIDVVMPSIT